MEPGPTVVPIGNNPTRLWGMTTDQRLARIARAQRIAFADEAPADGAVLLVNRDDVFDPAWLRHAAGRPGEVLTLGGRPMIAHCRTAEERAAVIASVASGDPLSCLTLTPVAHESGASMVNEQLRKREQPFALHLTPETVRTAERASYFGAYKGVTDLLTKYLWPEWALVLTRIAARIGMSPNMVTAIGAALCVLATVLFGYGWYWTGMAMGLIFMVLDTVDGKLARCTITSSKWGNVFDHGIDLIHPPFWWFAWMVGLEAYGRPLSSTTFEAVIGVLVVGYVAQRLVEGAFMRLYGMHVHVWRRFDSWFRLITARRNPNMVILFVSMIFARPDVGIIGVAWWTVASLVVHMVQLGQAVIAQARGREIRSWLG